MKINYHKLEKKIKVFFKDKNLLIKSLTHKSYSKEINYEKLEFLGDRVLGLVIAKKLLEIYPDEKEGVLDKKYASLVNKKTCLQIAKKINLDKYILTLDVRKKNNILENKVLSDCCEALIGSIYLDKGFNSVERFILELWSDNIKDSIITQVDAKTKLQELSLKKFKKLPVYKLISNTGPRHSPEFKVAVKLKNTKYINGIGSSKKAAEQEAAREFLKILKDELAR